MDTSLAATPTAHPSEETAQEVFLAWEKLRVRYNLLLTGAFILASIPFVGSLEYWKAMFSGFFLADAIVANALFCLGPVAEGYFSLMGGERAMARLLVFALGSLIAIWGVFSQVSADVAIVSMHFAH